MAARSKSSRCRSPSPSSEPPPPAPIGHNGGPALPDTFKLNPGQRRATKLLQGPQRHTLLVGGSRSGKTMFLCGAIVARAMVHAGSRHVIFRHRMNAVRASIGRDTLPKVRQLWFPKLRWRFNKSEAIFELSNGSEIWLAGLDDEQRVEKVLGLEFATIYFNECSQIPWGSADIALTRLAQQIEGCIQRAYYDLNPGGNRHWTYRLFFEKRYADQNRPLPDPDNYQHAFLNPEENRDNLSRAYLDSLMNAPERTRRRFYEGAYSPEMENALWKIEMIDAAREGGISPADARNRFGRICIGVDPSGTKGDPDERSDDVGIIVAAREPMHSTTGVRGAILEDATMNAHPKKWAAKVAELAKKWGADIIVAEKNFGGEMVKTIIEGAHPDCRVKLVTASKGKEVRAEPIAAEYERGLVYHCGRFDELEDEFLNMATDGYHGPRSPNRLDAAVFALSELFGKTMVPDDAVVYFGKASTFANKPW